MSNSKISEEMVQEMIHLLVDECVSVCDISKRCQIPRSTVSYVLKKNGINPKAIKDAQYQEIFKKATEEYVNGALMKDVINKYHICSTSIENYMKQHGITYQNQHGRKNFFNQDFFHDITTEAQAYYLGFLFADGAISGVGKEYSRLCRITINISAKDRIILERFADVINAQGNTRIRDYMPNEKSFGNSPMCKITLNSTRMADDLVNLGYYGLKPDRMSVPMLPQPMYRHFVRGYFDGDGSVTPKGYSIIGYRGFIHSLNLLLHDEIDLPIYDKYIDYPHIQADVCDLRISRKQLTSALFRYMYDDANYYLPRKKLSYQERHM